MNAQQSSSIETNLQELLSEIVSLLGRLERVADSCNPASGCYIQPKLVERWGAEETHRALRQGHRLLWNDWLRLPATLNQPDLLLYLRTHTARTNAVLDYKGHEWISSLVPRGVDDEQRTLFGGTLGLLLSLARVEELWKPVHPRIEKRGEHVVQQALDLVQNGFSDPDLSLITIGAALGVSEDHLGRLFKLHVKQSFRTYLRNVRIRAAIRLLEDSGQGIKTISNLAGYSDLSYFTRRFRTTIGSTPARFRDRRLLQFAWSRQLEPHVGFLPNEVEFLP